MLWEPGQNFVVPFAMFYKCQFFFNLVYLIVIVVFQTPLNIINMYGLHDSLHILSLLTKLDVSLEVRSGEALRLISSHINMLD